MAKTLSFVKLRAFSLFELLVVIAIFAMLSSMGLGAWCYYRYTAVQQMLTNRVKQALAFARLQAVLHHRIVLYCGSSDQAHCDGQWGLGQLVQEVDAKCLQTYPGIPPGTSLAFIGNLGHNREIRFTPNGFTNGQQGHFRICSSKLNYCNSLVIHYSGEVVEGHKLSNSRSSLTQRKLLNFLKV